jgi:hypothetical protein
MQCNVQQHLRHPNDPSYGGRDRKGNERDNIRGRGTVLSRCPDTHDMQQIKGIHERK